MARVLIPTPLRPYAGNQSELEVPGETVGHALGELVARYGALRRHLLDDTGEVRSFVNVYRNDEDIRHLERMATALNEGDVLSIVPSVAGGA